MKFNVIDLFIIASVLYFVITGYFQGFLRVVIDITSLVLSFFVALQSHKYVATIIEKFGVPADFSAVVSFFMIWALMEIILYLLIQFFYPKIPEFIRKSKTNKILGLLPSLLKGLVVTALLVLITISLPFSSKLEKLVDDSLIGKPIANQVSFLEKTVQDLFKDVIKPARFTIIKPSSDETIELDYRVKGGEIDEESEKKMLELLNKEREANGLKPLVMDKSVQKVARKHSDDMFEKGYFAHKNKEGKSPFDRLEAGGIKYLTAGENLALAPDVYIAHQGLMDSPGHRANILTPEFKRVGIGVIDGGRYGKMFTQNFTD